MGSQGDAGQFRTPRHIIDMMVEITAPLKNESILDPACGTAGFLISAYKYIKKQNQDENGNSTLNSDDKRRLMNNFAGYDISPDMVRLSRVNMYLHGFSNPNISEYDTLTSLDKWDDTYDVIFANPPFMTPKGGITPHSRYQVSAKRAEVLFVDYIAEHLNPTGRAAIIVPEGIVFQSQTAYKNLRKMLVEGNYLYGVISLPAGVFNPYSGVKTNILLIDRTLAKERDSILFVKVNNDGFDLGAQRREIKGSEIPDVINIFKEYQKGVDITTWENTILAEKSEISRQDYILVGERYKATTVSSISYPMVKLGEVCTINERSTDPSTMDSFIYIDISSLDNKTKEIHYDNVVKGIEAPSRARRLFKKGDILLSTVRPNLKAFGYVERDDTSNCVASTGFAVIRSDATVNSKFLYYMLLQDELIDQMIGMMGKGAYPSINQNDVANLRFPLPPLTVQEEIVAEIEGYQKIIDGARQVVENYRPYIKVPKGVDYICLGTICEIVRGSSPRPAGDPRYYGGPVPRLMVADITRDGMYVVPRIDNLTEEGARYSRPMKAGDVVIAVSGQPGTCAILLQDSCIHDGFVGLKNIASEYLSDFLCIYLNSIKESSQQLSVGAVFKNLKTDQIRELKIPCIDLVTQECIVKAIKDEMEIVNGNKRLIEIFQQKIKDKIAEVWGE